MLHPVHQNDVGNQTHRTGPLLNIAPSSLSGLFFVPSLKLYSMPGINCQRYICKEPGNSSHTAQDAVRVLDFKAFYFLLGFNVLILMFGSPGLC